MQEEKIILGIDPGTSIMGFGLVKKKGANLIKLHLPIQRFVMPRIYFQPILNTIKLSLDIP